MTNIKKIHLHPETIATTMAIFLLSIFLLVVINWGFSWMIYLFCVGGAVLISVVYPRAGFFAILFSMMVFGWSFALTPLYFDNLEIKLFPVDVVFGAVLLGTIFQIFSGKLKFSFQKRDWLVVGFIFLTGIYFIFSFWNPESFFSLAFSSLKNYGFYSLMYFAAAALFQNTKDRERLFQIFFFGASVLVGFILYGILNGEGLWVDVTPLSTIGQRTLGFHHAFYVSLALLALLAYWSFGKEKKDIFLKAVFVFWMLGIAGSLMRHLWIGLLVATGGIYFLIKKDQQKILCRNIFSYGIVLMIGMFLAVYFSWLFPQAEISENINAIGQYFGQRISSFSDISADDSFAWRESVWSAVWEKYRETPIFGIGLGEKIFISQGKYVDIVEVRNVHNSPLIILAQMGIFSIGLLFSLVFSLFRKARQKIISQKGDWMDLATLGGLVFYLAVFMFQPYLELNMLSLPFWMILGLLRADNLKLRG